MSRSRPLPGGGRAVEVEPERLVGFLQRFADTHGGAQRCTSGPAEVRVDAGDGSVATVAVPFVPVDLRDGTSTVVRHGLDVEELVAHLVAPRTVGLVLVRLGGYSVGVVRDGAVLAAKTGSRPVHGRNSAGGQSQQRFARRREGQARVALQAAADAVARVVLPRAAELDGVVLGGDRAALRALAGDRRLAALLDRAEPRVLEVGEPRRAVLDDAARRVRNVEVQLR
ncbi:MAG: hypothetical protein GEV09_19635 [Pseudonocardiaceae bacterium]|nr:hypothetical protein [Pseudonocardiaceae bacterium]